MSFSPEDGPGSDEAPFPDVLNDPDGAPPANPLDDVTVEMDNPAYQPPLKKSTKKKP